MDPFRKRGIPLKTVGILALLVVATLVGGVLTVARVSQLETVGKLKVLWTREVSGSKGVFSRIQAKIDYLGQLDVENQKLKLENASLKAEYDLFRSECEGKQFAQLTEKEMNESKHLTGAPLGRSLAAISYQPPKDLLPSQLFTLGMNYLEKGENEKAAVIFTDLIENEETASYKAPRYYLLVTTAWYRLQNFKMADAYLEEVLKEKESPQVLPYQTQARLWKALIAQQTQKNVKVQYWLKELMERQPESTEAKWINP